MQKPRFIAITGMIFLAALSRLAPHPWNMTPVMAIALFSGATLSDKKWAFGVPLLAMLLSDLYIGFYPGVAVTYAAFALAVVLGFSLRQNKSAARIGLATFAGSLIFFVLTNFASWLTLPDYPKSTQGLIACYAMAIPFFRNTLLGDVFYTALLFGSFALVERSVPALREEKITA